MRATKRSGTAASGRRSYTLEAVERRVLLSASFSAATTAALKAVPAGLQSRLFFQLAATATPDVGANGPFMNTLTPAEIRGGYGITGTGAGQTIAIIDAYDDPNAAADLATFDATYGLAPALLTKVDQDGNSVSANSPGDTSRDGSDPAEDSVETSLDIEWAHAMAPAAGILLVECNSLSNSDLDTGIATAANYPGVSVVSMSFGGAEYDGEQATDAIFTTPAGHQGVTFVAASGDTGAYAPDVAGPVLQPNYPATSDNVVAVGGTNLTVSRNDTYVSETGWGNGTQSYLSADSSGNPLGGSGGGISAYEAEPDYQQFVAGDVGGGMRTVPDVAMQGGPDQGVSVVDSYYTGSTTQPWIPSQIFGTSLACPLFAAGIVINADAARTSAGLSTLDGVSQTLPRLYELPSNAVHDITVGNNGYPAGVGYDLVTGRGSPDATFMAQDLASTYIGYHVFDDTFEVGVQQPGEAGIGGITVSLESTTGTVLATTTTDVDGFYQFLDPAAGSYLVHFTLPDGYHYSPLGTAADPLLNSTVSPTTGNVAITVKPGTDVGGAEDVPDANAGMFTETINIDSVSIQRPQAGMAPLTFTVTISPAATAANDFAVPYTTVDGTAADDTAATGPATVAHGDYDATSGVITFAPGVDTATITVEVLGNTDIEKDLLFTVVLSPPADEFDLTRSTTTGTGTIVNTSFPSVSVATTAGDTVTRSATADQTVEFPVTLSAPAPFEVTVTYTTADVSAVGGTDYDVTSGTLTFDVDATTGLTQTLTMDVPVVVLPGTNPELNKTFDLTIAAGTEVTVGTPSVGVGTILTNVLPTIAVQNAAVTESLTGLAELAFQIDVTPSLEQPITITYATADGTAVAGTDYQAVSGTLTLVPGTVEQTVDVPVYPEFLSASQKTLSFTIAESLADLNLTTPTAVGTIQYLATTSLPVSSGKKVAYTDDLGQKVTLSMTGPGTGDLIFLGTSSAATNAYEMMFNGTTAATNLSLHVPGAGQTTVNDLQVNGSLNSLSAKALNVVQGTAPAAVTVTGTVRTLDLGYLQDTSVTLGGSAGSRGVAVSLLRAVDTTITSAAPIASLAAGAYIDTTTAPEYITAPSVGTVHVTGTFGGTIRTTGAVAAIVVDGALTGGVDAADGIGSVVAGSMTGASLTAGSAAGGGGVTPLDGLSATRSTVGRVIVRSAFSDSTISAADVGRVTLGAVDPDADGTSFGIFGQQIASVTAATPVGGRIVKLVRPESLFEIGDFEVAPG